jgi:hypothetical protein
MELLIWPIEIQEADAASSRLSSIEHRGFSVSVAYLGVHTLHGRGTENGHNALKEFPTKPRPETETEDTTKIRAFMNTTKARSGMASTSRVRRRPVKGDVTGKDHFVAARLDDQ